MTAPRVSVVIPTHGRPAALARCLAALGRQTFAPKDFEVVVVDDGSPVPVSASSGAVAVRVVRQDRRGPAAARNRGIAEASGTFVAFTDDDCEPAPGWLASLADALSAQPAAGVGGPVVNALPGNACAEASQLLVSFLYDYYNRDGISARFFTSNNLAFARQTLVEAGGFSERYQHAAGEDRELCDRFVSGGGRLVFEPLAVVHHAHHLTFATFLRQHFTYGRGAWGFRRARAARGRRVEVEPLAFYRELVAYPVRRHGLWGLRHAALLAWAQAANASGFLWEAASAPDGRSAGPEDGHHS